MIRREPAVITPLFIELQEERDIIESIALALEDGSIDRSEMCNLAVSLDWVQIFVGWNHPAEYTSARQVYEEASRIYDGDPDWEPIVKYAFKWVAEHFESKETD